jgi:hypothetical protein
MAIRDNIKKDWESMKELSFRDKLVFVWDYYKIPLLVALVVFFLIGSFIYEQSTSKEAVLQGIFINSSSASEYTPEHILEDFLKTQEVDTNKYYADCRTNIYYEAANRKENQDNSSLVLSNKDALQLIVSQSGAGMLDYIVGPHDGMLELAYKGYFVDLSEVLSPEQYKKFQPYFLYLDQDVIDALREADDNWDFDADIPIPTSNAAQDLNSPVPFMIDLSQCEALMAAYGTDPDTLCIGIVKNAPNRDMVLLLIDYLL